MYTSESENAIGEHFAYVGELKFDLGFSAECTRQQKKIMLKNTEIIQKQPFVSDKSLS